MRRFDWKLTIQLNVLVLKLSGLWPKSGDTTRTRGAILFTIFLLASLLSQIINIFYILHDLTALTKTIYVLFTEALFIAKAYYFVKNTTLIEHLMAILNTERFQPKDLKQVALIQPGLRFWRLVYNTFMVMCVGANLFWAVFPLLDNSGEDKPLPFLAWYPYDTKTSPLFELTYLHQMASYTYICFTHVNIDTFIAALNTYIGGQFDILCDNLRNLHEEKDIHANLVECVEAHKQILDFADSSNQFFQWIIFLQISVGATIIGLTLFNITIVTPFSTEFIYYISFGMTMVVQTFLYCWFGNEVQIKSNNVPYAAYECNWTGFSPEMKKNLLFFIMKAQKPVQMSALKIFYLSLESFVKILKTAWSYFALLHQVSS